MHIFWQGKEQNSSPILARQWWRHFHLSLSLCISLSLSLSPKVPHAQYRKRFRASYNMCLSPRSGDPRLFIIPRSSSCMAAHVLDVTDSANGNTGFWRHHSEAMTLQKLTSSLVTNKTLTFFAVLGQARPRLKQQPALWCSSSWRLQYECLTWYFFDGLSCSR